MRERLLKEMAKRRLAGVGWTVLRLAGRRSDEPRIAVVMYHSAGGASAMSLPIDVIDAHFAAIRNFGPSLTVAELSQLPQEENDDRLVCITFDDGFDDNQRVVLPLLVRHGLKATFFICSGFVDGTCDVPSRGGAYKGLPPMNWAQVRDLAQSGMEIGAHSVSHRLLAGLSLAEQENEMVQSKRRIEEEVGSQVVSFAIPYGNRGTYTNATLALAARHFRACCTTRFATNSMRLRRHDGMIVLDRVQPFPTDTAGDLQAKLSGRWDAMRVLQRGRRRA